MNWLRVLMVAAALLIPLPAGALPAESGGSGLIIMRTADVLERGNADLMLSGAFESYKVPSSNERDLDGKAALGLTYGIWKNVEVGLRIPYTRLTSSTGGLDNIAGMAKVRVLGGREQGYGVALTGYSDLFDTSDSSKGIGSGKMNYGGELSASYHVGGAGLHLTAGYGAGDTKVPARTGSYFVRDTALTGALGVEIYPVPDLGIIVEMIARRIVRTNDDNIIIAPGLRYIVNERTAVTLGLGVGVPDDRSQPMVRFMAGLTVGLGGTREKVRSVATYMGQTDSRMQKDEARLESFANETNNRFAKLDREGTPRPKDGERAAGDAAARIELLQDEVSRLSGRVAALEQAQARQTAAVVPVPAPVPVAVSAGAGAKKKEDIVIEVLNGARIQGIAGRLASALKAMGYKTPSVGNAKGDVRTATVIYYREGYQQEAETIARSIKKDKLELRKEALAEGTDLRIIIGTDLKGAY